MKRILFTFLLISVKLTINAQNGVVVSPAANESKVSMKIANGNGTLGSVYNTSKCGLNFAYARASVSTRNSTTTGTGLPAALSISGIPTTCTTIEKAYIWSIVAYNYGSAGQPSPPTFSVLNPGGGLFNYTASLVGTDVAKCWGEGDSRTFRADVTTAITTNGTYTINTNSPAASVDGVLLMIIYSDGDAAYTGRMIMFDGCNSNDAGAAATQSMPFGTAACANSSYARAFNLVADCQYPAAVVHKSTLNGTTTSFTDNFFNFDIAATAITSGQSTANFGVTPGSAALISDCYAWGLMGVYYQTTSCGACISCLAVPVELINFRADKLDKVVLLSWETASEKNSSSFEIEKSTDGKTYSTISTLPANSFSNTLNKYSFKDYSTIAGKAYYRLKMLDLSGEFSYSSLLTVRTNLGKPISIKTNKEGVESILIENTGSNGEAMQVYIYNLMGQVIYQQMYNSDSQNIHIDISVLPKGYYLVKAMQANELIGTEKLIR